MRTVSVSARLQQVEFLLRAFRVITQRLHFQRGLRPGTMQIDDSFVDNAGASMLDTQGVIVTGLPDAMTDRLESGLGNQCLDAGQIRLRHLHHDTQLLGKQCREGIITEALISQCSPLRPANAISQRLTTSPPSERS